MGSFPATPVLPWGGVSLLEASFVVWLMGGTCGGCRRWLCLSPLCLLPTTITPVQMILQLLALAQPCPAVGGAACAREVSVSRLAGLAAQYGTAGLTELVSAEPEDKGWVFPKALRVEQDSHAAGACGPLSGGSVSSPRFTHDVHHRLSSRVTGALSVLPREGMAARLRDHQEVSPFS